MSCRIEKAIPCLLFVGLSGGLLFAQQNGNEGRAALPPEEVQRIASEVHKQIMMLPQYGVFDNIAFGIQGSTVILEGQASRPILKSSAENVVKRIEGVSSVTNNIEVLPLSPNDDRIRARVYAAIYRYPALARYTNNRGGGGRYISPTAARMGITNDPPIGWHAIHIIVKNGNVRLVGVVDNSGDLAIAEMRANGVPGVFRVDNDLQVASKQ